MRLLTDSDEIYNTIKLTNGNVIKSIKDHDCGSDRIAEAVEAMDVDIIVNVQGDEPFIDEESLSKLVELFKNDNNNEIDLASLKVQLKESSNIENPNNVKVITDLKGFALYFSRSVIPFHRDNNTDVKYYKHIGVYAFRKAALMEFYDLNLTPLESAEKIEAIRYLEVGKKIKMLETNFQAIGIDIPEDLEKAKKLLES